MRPPRAGLDQHPPLADLRLKGRDLLGERRRRGAGLRKVLIAVPGAGDAAVDDLAFAQRAVLVRAHVGDRGDPAIVLKTATRSPSSETTRARFSGMLANSHGVEGRPVLRRARRGGPPPGAAQSRRHPQPSTAGQPAGWFPTAARPAPRARSAAHKPRRPSCAAASRPRRGEIVQPEIVAGGGHQKQDQQREKAERLKREIRARCRSACC